MTSRLFGTDGIRARAGEFPLNSAAVVAIGEAIGEKLGGKILIGQDTRLSSPWILDRMRKGIARTTAVIEDAGVIPTPAIALLTKYSRFAGGVMISASHNPYDDNGIKVFGNDGRKLSDTDELAVEKRIGELLDGQADRGVDDIPSPRITASNASSWPARYEELLTSHFPPGRWLTGIHMVVDCANGAMSEIAPLLLRNLGAGVTVINAQPTGRNINAGCGAVHLESLTAAMKQERSAHIGVAFDGDGDRSMFITSSGRIVDGDAVLLVMARRLKQQGKLDPPTVVGTLMTNFSLERILRAEGIEVKRVAVGDRYIFEEIQKGGGVIGGEPSGHIIFPDFELSGDALLTTLKVAEALVSEHASLDDLTKDWIPSPQLLTGVRIHQKVPIENLPALQAKMKEVTNTLGDRGRLVIRYSGTEPLLRVMIESDDAKWNDRLMEEILAVISREL